MPFRRRLGVVAKLEKLGIDETLLLRFPRGPWQPGNVPTLGRENRKKIERKLAKMNEQLQEQSSRVRSLYHHDHEHDACGVGFIASVHGERSNKVLALGLASLCNLTHRGALDADLKTGDGAGVLTQLPVGLFRPEIERLGHTLYQDQDLGVGVFFLPHDNAYAQARVKATTEEVLEKRGLYLFGWREVPVNLNVLGSKAQSTMPRIEHAMVGRPDGLEDGLQYERLLFLARKEIEHRCAKDGVRNFYIASFSHRVIAYKGLLISPSLQKYYRDLQNPAFETAICVYHQRYSTNTFPTWPLGQPFRMLAHNGEINTIRGNRNWMRAREAEFNHDFWKEDVEVLSPIIQPGGSDSASLDNALEALVMSGRDILHSMTMLVPPAWRNDRFVAPELAAFYEYHRCFNEPWDGPAALVFSDGVTVGACLDRNGLRPARFKLTVDGIFSMASEAGTLTLDDAKVVEKGRLAPGEMLAIDTVAGKLLRDAEIKERLSHAQPYRKWLETHLTRLDAVVSPVAPMVKGEFDILGLTQRQMAFGYTSEEIDMILAPMVATGKESIGSMGDDTPLAVLSLQPRLLYTYFKQIFAQVTNPPIDPIREKTVMSLVVNMGWHRNLFEETLDHARMLTADSPVLFDHELAAIRALENPDLKTATVSILWDAAEGEAALHGAIQRICAEADAAIDAGARLLVLSDKGVDHAQAAVPMLLATGALHHHLTRGGRRMKAAILCETGEARDVHQVACLIGYGASAINPYLAFETIREMLEHDPKGKFVGVTYPKALAQYRKAVEAGLLKIMSKMGISVLGSYRGAQIFEAIGISSKVIHDCFFGTPSQVEGIGYEEIAGETLRRHAAGFAEAIPDEKPLTLNDPGFYRFRRSGEAHAVTPPVIKNFHTFVKNGAKEDYEKYVASVLASHPISLRDVLEFVPAASGPVPIEEVEPIEEIRRRFTTAGMSYGALSPEAHEALAIAMNRIGGKSNSGEGGEDPERFHRRPNGDLANSAIKQVASGRFGVKASYLASAKEIEIKMAQGAKPGEGGQLPAYKVVSLIAKLRHSMPGTELISPPPHHDIYSIEDLAQLIYDLKQVNPRARVCVKLVAEAGVGTIAAGVAKAHADIILISGHEGGTGASPQSSIKHAGGPWELGLAEAHQVLMMNNLRNRVTLRTDGGLRTGADIVYASILGAEEYNFGTAALIALGCVYVRQCHLNTCPVGVATLDERLRGKFKGSPDMVVHFFNAVAEEVRGILARLGVRSIHELIGRTEFLRQRVIPDHPKANTLDLGLLLANVSGSDETAPRYSTMERNDGVENFRPLDDSILQDAKDAINEQQPVVLEYKVKNTNRSIGTKLSGEIGYQYGEEGLPEGTITLNLRGSAGQSFGAFLSQGVKMVLTGEGNDYVGKGMSGGEIVVRPPAERKFTASDAMIIGNTVMYGATGGRLFTSGRAGERFCVRNSGGIAVVEGIGDHGCEYMTNGCVVVLGSTGKNFGAGMTGGTAYVLDQEENFEGRCNLETIALNRIDSEADAVSLKELIYAHLESTDSERANQVLGDWPQFQKKFWKITPKPKAQPADAVTPEPAEAVAPAKA